MLALNNLAKATVRLVYQVTVLRAALSILFNLAGCTASVPGKTHALDGMYLTLKIATLPRNRKTNKQQIGRQTDKQNTKLYYAVSLRCVCCPRWTSAMNLCFFRKNGLLMKKPLRGRKKCHVLSTPTIFACNRSQNVSRFASYYNTWLWLRGSPSFAEDELAGAQPRTFGSPRGDPRIGVQGL